MSQNYEFAWRFSGETLQCGEKKNLSVYSKVVFIKKQPVTAKALFWRWRVLCRGCCVHLLSDFHNNSDAYLRQAPNSQNHLSSRCRIQILFIKLQFNFMNFNQYSLLHMHTNICIQNRCLDFQFLKKTLKHKYLTIYSCDWYLQPTGCKFITNTVVFPL